MNTFKAGDYTFNIPDELNISYINNDLIILLNYYCTEVLAKINILDDSISIEHLSNLLYSYEDKYITIQLTYSEVNG